MMNKTEMLFTRSEAVRRKIHEAKINTGDAPSTDTLGLASCSILDVRCNDKSVPFVGFLVRKSEMLIKSSSFSTRELLNRLCTR